MRRDSLVDSRINKVLSLQTDSAAMCEALDNISEFYTANTIESRRNLRYDLEGKNIAIAKQFIAEYRTLLDKMCDVESRSSALENECTRLAVSVAEADNNMKEFMQKASELEARQKLQLDLSAEIESFLKKFSLSNEEIEVLQHASIDNVQSAKSFFAALSHLCEAYRDCKSMVSSNNYNAGFELLDVLGRHQDVAFERLFEWVKVKCESIPDAASEDMDVKLQVAIKYLRNIPAYFAQCQDLVANSRRNQIVQRFIAALTQGNASGHLSGAIDLYAHDAVRYVSDMLAWAHQAVVGEEEFLTAVFGHLLNASSDDLGSEALPGLNLQELLARCLQGLGRPLRMRILQSLEGVLELGQLFSLHDLLSFYETTFARIVRSENAVHSAVKGSLLECKRSMTAALNRQTEALVSTPLSYPIDLSAAEVTLQCARQIQDILKVHATALSQADESDGCSVLNVLRGIVQPLLQACRNSGQGLDASDLAVYMLNNVAVLHLEFVVSSRRASAASVSSLSSLLETEASSWQDVLVAEEVQAQLRKSSMDAIALALKGVPIGRAPATVPGLDAERVATSLERFYSSLFLPFAAQLDRLQDSVIRESLRRRAADALCAAYSAIHVVVADAASGYDSSMLTHSVDEVRVLLGSS